MGAAWVDRVVRRCLAKDPEDRYQAMRDVVIELRTGEGPLPSGRGSVGDGKVGGGRWLWAVAAVCLVAAMLGWGAWMRTSFRRHPFIDCLLRGPGGHLPARLDHYYHIDLYWLDLEAFEGVQ